MELSAGAGERLGEFQTASEENAIGAAEFKAIRRGDAGAAEADGVEAGDGIFAAGNGEGRKVLADAGIALHERECADADELVEETIA